ncbi:MAG: aminotransferase class III-fold pyridoxal phosphate-dependent enzyme, partial [Pirellulales bacterium]|nr:aminotransferase class III-fold pyridoxal phosphate-dependent enzyme [Pirellulales bacterium]
CGYHGWHDWYLSANWGKGNLDSHLLPGLAPKGVPSQLAGTTLPFTYNKLDELEEIVNDHGSDLAAIIMEPTRMHEPQPGFLEGVREIADRCGAVLVFDEVSIGWRLALGGAHLKYGVDPDIAVFAKSMGNGHPSAAVVGRGDVMDAAQDSFISSTYWTEGVGSAAALAVIRKMQRVDVRSHIARIGTMLREGLMGLAEKHGLPLTCAGHPPLPCFNFDHDDNLALQTLYTRRMLDHDILANFAVSICLAHTEEHIDRYLAAAAQVFPELAEAMEKGDAAERIGGPIRHTAFSRLA